MSATRTTPARAPEPDRPSTSDPPDPAGSADDTATAPFPRPSGTGTHRVVNQAPPLLGHDPLGCDPALVEAVRREGAGEALPSLRQLGALITSAEAAEHARLAETHPPVLHTPDRYGHRIDDVEFHPSWHWLLRTAVGWGLHGTPWVAEPGTGAHVARAAGFYLMAQLESGHGCPISMTYAAVPALRRDPELAAAFEPGLRSCVYQPGATDPAKKTGLLAGMSMTEAHGGSDVRAASTTATPSPDGSYRLVGHKWFTSAPTNDLFLTLAQAPGGLTCFVLPRVLPDGTRNAITLLRLKNKLGNRSNASAEIEYTGATGWRLGDEGRGVAAIIEMVSMTRLDCVLGSAALTRVALSEAAHHAAHRSAFGARLADAPLMQSVLSDLALESEAATALALRLAGAADRDERPFLRLALPAAKYLVCKRAPAVVAEALECLGGNGFVEDSGLPRRYREAPLNSIWEGSGNVNALDVLRAVGREPPAVEALDKELSQARGLDRRVDAAMDRTLAAMRAVASADPVDSQLGARRLVQDLAVALQAALVVQYSPSVVAETFVASRLGDADGRVFGTLPVGAAAAKEVVDLAFAG